MRDDKGEDDKIVAVCIDDPAVARYMTAEQLPPHLLRELDCFFSRYKMLEGKESIVESMHDRPTALSVIEAARQSYLQGDWKAK
jgi:inorganic pyrophosphatase